MTGNGVDDDNAEGMMLVMMTMQRVYGGVVGALMAVKVQWQDVVMMTVVYRSRVCMPLLASNDTRSCLNKAGAILHSSSANHSSCANNRMKFIKTKMQMQIITNTGQISKLHVGPKLD